MKDKIPQAVQEDLKYMDAINVSPVGKLMYYLGFTLGLQHSISSVPESVLALMRAECSKNLKHTPQEKPTTHTE
mgnify:CR=1 FL=1